jgi:DNA-directed RNA polymerase subunit E'/Rpb7
MDQHITQVDAIHCNLLLTAAVRFRLIVFKPFENEIMIGRVKTSNEEGIQGAHLSLDEF